MVKTTAMGCRVVITASPVASAAWIMLPASTRRSPMRPATGATTRQKPSWSWALSTRPWSVAMVPASWSTAAAWVSICCWVKMVPPPL